MTAMLPRRLCVSRTTIVKKYLEDHPEKLHEQGASLVISSLATAFPSCYVEPDYVKESDLKSLDALSDDDGY